MVASYSLDFFFFAILLLSTATRVIPITPLSPLTDYSVLSSYHTTYPFHHLPSYSTSFVNYSFRVDYVPSSSSSFHFFVLASSVIRSSTCHSSQAFFLFYSFRHMMGPGDTNNSFGLISGISNTGHGCRGVMSVFRFQGSCVFVCL